ncbi:MAG: molybdopterin-dependent oxidoreductase, partial [Pelolinea sp.]|nr:molybdopterin-dependent oxidoreductase [Pelolinea sp.]
CGAFRGYGSPQVTFAAETHFEHMICELGLDPIETRLKNALDYGKSTTTGDVLTEDVGAGMVECLKAVKQELAKTEIPTGEKGEKIGVGIACAYKNVGLGANIPDQAGAVVQLEPDGKFLVRHGAADMGQGSNQVMAVITSKVLGIPVGDIRVHTGDTRLDPHGGMTTASRATFVTGNAVLIAAEGLKKYLWDFVANEFHVEPYELIIENGKFVNKNDGREYIQLKELVINGEEFVYESSYDAPTTQPPNEFNDSNPEIPDAPLHFAYDFGAQAAIVAVNEEKGTVRVLKMIVAHDCGTPIIYKNVIGQLEGAAIQGMGYALSESFEYEQGVPKSLKFNDLGITRFRDLPEIIVIPITTPHPKGPFGAKGMGELAITPTAPAIINAIHNAAGIWIRELPATKEKILEAIRVKREMEVE